MDDMKKSARQLAYELKVAQYVARVVAGDNAKDAYLATHRKAKRLDPAALDKAVSKFSNAPAVKSALRKAIASLPSENILTSSEWGKMVLDLTNLSVTKENLTAAAAFTRQLGQYTGAIKEQQTVVNTWK